MSNPTTTNWGLNLEVGPAWFRLPVGPGADQLPSIEQQVDRRIELDHVLDGRRDTLIEMLQHFTDRAIQRQVAAAGLRWELDQLDGAVAGTMDITAHDTHVLSPRGQLEERRQALTGRQANQISEPQVELRQLQQGGQALRMQVLLEVPERPPGHDTNMVIETVQYWVPVPNYPIMLLVLFSTPNLAAADKMIEELDGIVEQNLQIT